MIINDILSAIPWGILLSFTIGPVFFVLLETGISKGIRAALIFDLGVVFADVFFILIAYFSTNQLLEKLKDDPGLFVFGGIIMFSFGIFSFLREKKNFQKNNEIELDDDNIPKNNYIGLFFKGFLLNFINIGVLGFWLGIIIVFGPKMNMETDRIFLFITTIIVTYFLIDILKINVAKQLKSKLTPFNIYKIKRVINVVLMIFGTFLLVQGFFPKQKDMIKAKLIKEFKK